MAGVRLADLHPSTVVHAGVASVGAFSRGTLRLLGGDLDPHGDARVGLLVDAPPDEVWAVLADGEAYGDWVVGAKPVRTVDADWPEVGASLAYSVGVGPVELRDRTTVRRSEPGHLLDLDVSVPGGSVRVVLRLQAQGSRTLVELDEYPSGGLIGLLHSPVGSAAFAARGALMLRRLRDLVEHSR
jgi:uncharacterized protein YndB with AHSA1/START domain